MTPLRKQLLDMIVEPDVYDRPPGELLPLQLAAARELVEERRSQISVLRRRADETGVGEIRSLADLVPLLFAHSVYKSYPSCVHRAGTLGPDAAVAANLVGGEGHEYRCGRCTGCG